MFTRDDDVERLCARGVLLRAEDWLQMIGYADRDELVLHRQLLLVKETQQTIDGFGGQAREDVLASMEEYLSPETLVWGQAATGNCIVPLDPARRWCEFKIRTLPQVRLFGAFLRLDYFIVLEARWRRDVDRHLQDRLDWKWRKLWGDDAYRCPVNDYSVLLTNARTGS